MSTIVVSPDLAQAIAVAVYAEAREAGMSKQRADRLMVRVLMRLGIEQATDVDQQRTVEKATDV